MNYRRSGMLELVKHLNNLLKRDWKHLLIDFILGSRREMNAI